ncbi:uncharacterized protein M421DRAFT_426793 [Didymella exigua CBS 183.55]|uniref:Uncharacterized protein n=1 Tax=Didymella exigua CBS 183.55 TaxID=1150837 RepID=A0A6A5R3C0_9PLEO|nr:uncharacterized protein M421DRAFT_426793 [Didymella exigua CBS 183.55]KAF1922551.1 hypothetical protein M421DRAFT_426793 [Didymella exigua CBS 183.55]
MFSSIKNVSIIALCLAVSTNAAAIPSVSPEALNAFGITEADLIQARSAPESDLVEARATLQARVASCKPPQTPANATYGACVLPLTTEARNGNTILMIILAEYMTKRMGCPLDGISGAANRPIGNIMARRCGGPGPERIDQGVQGFSINSSFNEAPCRPGSKCS